MYKNPKTGLPEKKFFFELKYDTFVGKPKDEVRLQYEDTFMDSNEPGVIRWAKSKNVVPEDFLYDFRDMGLIPHEFIDLSLKAKDIDMTRHVKEYIEADQKFRKEDPEGYAEMKREQMFEARAALGPGEDVVNILTGETFST